jgi:hypothetical protein
VNILAVILLAKYAKMDHAMEKNPALMQQSQRW